MYDLETSQLTEKDYAFILDQIPTPLGSVPRIKTELSRNDLFTNALARMGIARDDYRVIPGLYAVGTPGDKSPILVTANYKLTFDMVRKELSGVDAWLLVIDTFGVNMWCAAGKGTFGTDEVIHRIEVTGLKKHTKSRQLILPQLGAPGVAGWMVTRSTGFRVLFGPVRSSDLKEYIEKGYKADEAMRTVTFNWKERWSVTPIEFVHNFYWFPLCLVVLFILKVYCLGNPYGALMESLLSVLPYWGALLLSTLAFPLLLPYLPFRRFALKGAFLGGLWYLLLLAFPFWYPAGGVLVAVGTGALILPLCSWISMNFTGSTTFTSYSGVKKEVDEALRPILGTGIVGILLLLISTFVFKLI